MINVHAFHEQATEESRVRSQEYSYAIWNWQSCTGTGFSPITSIIFYDYHSTLYLYYTRQLVSERVAKLKKCIFELFCSQIYFGLNNFILFLRRFSKHEIINGACMRQNKLLFAFGLNKSEFVKKDNIFKKI